MVQVKICGLNDRSGLQAAYEYGADWVGFVFYHRSPRYILPQHARNLINEVLPPSFKGSTNSLYPKIVGLFVDATWPEIEKTIKDVPLDIIQFYGEEQEIQNIKRYSLFSVWHSRGISSSSDLPSETKADGLVIESKAGDNDILPGGNGRRFDWSLPAHWQAPVPWLLAGGLTPQNVTQAVKQSKAKAVDVSSGVEEKPGKKDPFLIRDFLQAAKYV